ncbi:hypothetical protein BH24ACT4_BH24ACT4_23620 [soil metagenome]
MAAVTLVEPAPRAPAPHREAPEHDHGPESWLRGPEAGAGPDTWAPPEPGRFLRANHRHPWLMPTVIGAAATVATAYTAWQDPNRAGMFPGCPLRELTGWDCPGCGGLRATHALTRGDIFGALDHNVWVTVGVPIAAVLWLFWLLRTLGVHDRRLPKVPSAVWWSLGAALLVFTVVRNIPGVAAFEYLNSFT